MGGWNIDDVCIFAPDTPDNRLEILRVGSRGVSRIGSVPVGMEPVALAVRNRREVWVVNHLSDSVSIVDVVQRKVVRTLLVGDEPRASVLLDAVDDYIQSIPRLGCCGYGIADVEIAALRGDSESALAALESAIAEGWKTDWWWETDYNPNLSGLRGDERYRLAIDALAESMTERLASVVGS